MLINNAGLAIGLQHLHTYAIEDIDQMIDTNIKGFTYIANSVIPLMIATGKVGTIVNVGSVAGEIDLPQWQYLLRDQVCRKSPQRCDAYRANGQKI